MNILRYPAGVYQANCYIIYNDTSKEGFIVDPGGDEDGIIEEINKLKVNIRFIILTHGHFDHTGAVNKVKQRLGIPVFINEKDKFLISGNDIAPLPPAEAIVPDGYLKDGDVFTLGSEKITIIETPGHSPGGIVINAGNFIITGDTLFNGSVGRTDLPGGSYDDLIKSIRDKILVFDDSVLVYPGHGPSTSIGYEKKYNPFL